MFHFLCVRPAHARLLSAPVGTVMGLTLLLASAGAQSQSAPAPTKADPQDPQASVPALVYVSSLRASKAPVEQAALSWRQANDTVTRIGGWRAYVREAQQPDTPAAPAAATGSMHQHPHPDAAKPKVHGNHQSMHRGHQGHSTP
jgi:hypothetical protein